MDPERERDVQFTVHRLQVVPAPLAGEPSSSPPAAGPRRNPGGPKRTCSYSRHASVIPKQAFVDRDLVGLAEF